MLRILGSPRRLCDGLTRRELLLAGGLGLLTSGLQSATAPAATPRKPTADRRFGQAKNVILLYLFGGPTHVEMFDMKPAAPAEVRGEFKPIRSRLPGCDVCEHLPNVAKVMDRVTVLRSLSHVTNFHGMQFATTGLPQGSVPIEETQRHSEQQPFIGSICHYLSHQKHGPKPRGSVPDNIILPWLLSSRRPQEMYARPHAGFLGPMYEPLWGDFRGKATRNVDRWTFGPRANYHDPHLGITPDSRFEIASGTELSAGLTLDRLSRRRSLLEQFDQARRGLDRAEATRGFDRQRELAFSLVNSAKMRTALDLGREPDRVREAYGLTLFGQGVLQARRLLEAGCRFVTVIWDEFGQLNSGWDTHVDHFNRLRNELLPGFDHAFSALIEDLTLRGLLDETLVLVLNEMGRTPRLSREGRDHWEFAYTNLLAGGGVARGQVVGQTDKIGARVIERPLSAKDVLATAYHLLGIDPHSVLIDRLNRPVPLVPYGDVIREALA